MVLDLCLGADSMAEHLAEEVIEANTDFDGLERAPMRMAEARITRFLVLCHLIGPQEGPVRRRNLDRRSASRWCRCP